MASVFKSESFLKLSPADQSRNINLINLGRFLENYFEFGLKNEKVCVCALSVCTRESSDERSIFAIRIERHFGLKR